MTAARATVFSLILLMGLAVTADAFAHGRGHFHGGARFGVFVGAPAFWYYPPPYYYSPYPSYYYPQSAVVPSAPATYVEQGQAGAPPVTQSQEGYWYYCRPSNAYYPYVEQCAAQWEQVPPRPAS